MQMQIRTHSVVKCPTQQIITFFSFVHENVLHLLRHRSIYTPSEFQTKHPFNTIIHTNMCICNCLPKPPFPSIGNSCWETKAAFRSVSNRHSRVIKCSKEDYAELVKEKISNERLGSREFWRKTNRILNLGKSPIPTIANGPECISSTVDMASLVGKLFA